MKLDDISSRQDDIAKSLKQLTRYVRRALSPKSLSAVQMQAGVSAQQPGFSLGGPAPTITGVSVPLLFPMPDGSGRELAIRIHFSPESAQSIQHLQALINWCTQAYGQYLAAKRPWRERSSSDDRDRYSDRGRRY